MNELIKVEIGENQEQIVFAKEIHSALGIQKDFTSWFKQKAEALGLEEGKDFTPIWGESTGGRPGVDYRMSVNTAKHLCMVSGGDRAHEVRQYLIDIETAWNQPTLVLARALKWADQQMTIYQAQISEMKPKAEFYDTVTGSRTALPFNHAAKVLGYRGMGRNNLFAFLRENGVLMADNQPYQAYIDRGYFRVIETKYTKPNGDIGINVKTLIYQKGLDYVRKLLDKAGYKQLEASRAGLVLV